MNRGIFFFLFSLLLGTILLSCSDDSTRSYTDMLVDQDKIISQLIDDNDLEILKNYPEDGVFGPNQFVKLDNGLYMNVVDSGNGNRAILNKTTILTRFTAELVYYGDTIQVNSFTDESVNPVPYLEFKYGSSTVADSNTQYEYADYLGTGYTTPLDYVGDSAIVKLIVPFELSASSSPFATSGIPVYFTKIRYAFEK